MHIVSVIFICNNHSIHLPPRQLLRSTQTTSDPATITTTISWTITILDKQFNHDTICKTNTYPDKWKLNETKNLTIRALQQCYLYYRNELLSNSLCTAKPTIITLPTNDSLPVQSTPQQVLQQCKWNQYSTLSIITTKYNFQHDERTGQLHELSGYHVWYGAHRPWNTLKLPSLAAIFNSAQKNALTPMKPPSTICSCNLS